MMNNAQKFSNLISVDPESAINGAFDSSIIFVDELNLKNPISSLEPEDVFAWIKKSDTAYLYAFNDSSLLVVGETGENPITVWQFMFLLEELIAEPKRLQQMLLLSDTLKEFFEFVIKEFAKVVETIKLTVDLPSGD